MKLLLVFFILCFIQLSCTKILVETQSPCVNCNTTELIPLFQSTTDSNTQYLVFRGIRPDDPGGKEAIDNPERGFRFEFIMKANDLVNHPEPSPPERRVQQKSRQEPGGRVLPECFLADDVEVKQRGRQNAHGDEC